MKRIISFIISVGLISTSYATWGIAGSSVRTPGSQPNLIIDNTPVQYRANPALNLNTKPGRLYDNLQCYTASQGWTLRWKAKSKKYPVNIKSTIGGLSVPQVINRLLSYYPLKATYNNRDKIVTVWSKK